MLKRLHPAAGVLAFVTIFTFWLSTIVVELTGTPNEIASVKHAISLGLFVLVPALMATAASGFRLARASKSALVQRKKRRMPFIALNGLLILLPSALILAKLSAQGNFGTLFHTVQAVELCAGAVNLSLIALSARDGLRLTGRLRRA